MVLFAKFVTCLPARRYTDTVLAAVALSVCPFVTSHRSIKAAGRIKLVFGTEASFGLSYIILCHRLYMESRFPLKLCSKYST